MNPVIFTASVMSHCDGGSGVKGFLVMLLTLFVVGIILYAIGIFANILHIKISNGFAYTPICWHDIKPGELGNPMLGWIGGIFGIAFIGVAVLMALVAGVFWFIVTL